MKPTNIVLSRFGTPTKIFFCGAVLAAVLAGAGFVNSYWLDHKLALLEAECVESGQRERKRTGLDVRPVCDGETLAGLARQQKFDGTGPLQGEQAKIASQCCPNVNRTESTGYEIHN